MASARRTYLGAAERARNAGQVERLAEAALGLAGGGGFEVTLFDSVQVDLLEEARAGLVERPSVLLAWVTARLSVALSLVAPGDRRLALAELVGQPTFAWYVPLGGRCAP